MSRQVPSPIIRTQSFSPVVPWLFGSPDAKFAYAPLTGAPVAPPVQNVWPVDQTNAPSVTVSAAPIQLSPVPMSPETNWFSAKSLIATRRQVEPRSEQLLTALL